MKGFLSSVPRILLVSLICLTALCPSPSIAVALATEPAVLIAPGISSSTIAFDKDTSPGNVLRDVSVPPVDAIARTRVMEAYTQLSTSFIPNQGQMEEQVEYYVQSGGQSLRFATDGVMMALSETTLRLRFLDANSAVRLEGADKLPGVLNYFIGNDPAQWRTHISTYGRIAYRDLWPGVDLAYAGQAGVLKSTYTIAPGADPAQIRLAYPEVDRLAVDQQGNLIVSIAGQELQEIAPLAWQEIDGQRVPVAVTYRVVGRTSYTFALPEGYDPAYPLVIDPELIYATFLGGGEHDYGYAVAVDDKGCAYVTGYTYSSYFDPSPFPTTAGAFDTTYNSVNPHTGDAFVVKLNANGTELEYATFLGGGLTDIGKAIAVDGSGYAYVAGTTDSPDFPTTPGALDTSIDGYGGDAFVVKLDAVGAVLLYATLLGGSSFDEGYAIAVDRSGGAYVTGQTDSPDFPTTARAFAPTYNGGYFDAFVVRLSPDGTALAYATFLGGSDADEGYGIVVDGTENAYITGSTWSSDFPTTPGAFDTSHNGDYDVFVVKMSPDGAGLVYGTCLGGSLEDKGYGIAVDGMASVYLTGYTHSSEFPTSPEAFDVSHNGYYDAFVVKISPDGTGLVYGTFLGGSNDDRGYGIAVDAADNAYVVGSADLSDFPTTAGAFETNLDDYGNAFLVKMNAAGTELVYATFLGGGGYDSAIAVDEGGSVYVVGSTDSDSFPTTASAFDISHNGSLDTFVIKLDLGTTLSEGPPSPIEEAQPHAVANFASLLSEKREYIDYLSAPSFELETVPITITAPGFDETQASELSSKLQADYERYMAGELSVEDAAAFERQASAFSRLTAVERAYAGLYQMHITTSQDVAKSFVSFTFLGLEFAEYSRTFNLQDGVPGDAQFDYTEYLTYLIDLQSQIADKILDVVSNAWSVAADRIPDKEIREQFLDFKDLVFQAVKLQVESRKDESKFRDIFGNLIQDILSDAVSCAGPAYYIKQNQATLDESIGYVKDAADEVVYQRLVHDADADVLWQIDSLLRDARIPTDHLHNTIEDAERRLHWLELYQDLTDLVGIGWAPARVAALLARIARAAIIAYDGTNSFEHLVFLQEASRESQVCAFDPVNCRLPSSSSGVSVAIASSDPTFFPSYHLSGGGLLVQSLDSVSSSANHDALKSERQRFLAQQVQRLQVAGDDYLALQQQVVEAINRGDIEVAGTLIPELLNAEDELSAHFTVGRAPIQAIASLPETQNEAFSQAYGQLFIAGNDFDANIVSFYALLMGVLVSPDGSALRQQTVDQAGTVAASIQTYQGSIEEMLPAAAELPAQPKVLIGTYQIIGQDVTVKLVNATPVLASDVRVEMANGPEANVVALKPGESREVVLQVDQTGFQLIKVLVGDRTTDTKIVMIEAGVAIQSPFAGLSDLSTVMDWVLYCSLSLICVSGLGLALLGGIVLARRRK